MSNILDRWYPPTSLQGHHWRCEVLHTNGQWVWYTEHLTEADAQAFCAAKQFHHPLDQWRVVEAYR